MIEGEGLGKGPHQPDRHQQSKRTTTLTMELEGGIAEIVLIRCDGWCFSFYVDPSPAPGLLRDLADTVGTIVSAVAA